MLNCLRFGRFDRARRFAWLAGLLLAAPLLVAAGNDSAAAPDPDPQRFADAIKGFERWDAKNAWPQDPVLFVGSSSIVMWQTHDAFPDWPVVNRGFGGSHISDVNHYFDKVVTPYHARVILFYCGDNDIAGGKSPQQVLEDYAEFARHVHEVAPEAHLVYLPIKPSTSRWKLWPQMKETNELIKAHIAKDPLQSYLDLTTPMLDPDGNPRPELLRDDGLHMNADGYAIWNEAVRAHVGKLLTRQGGH